MSGLYHKIGILEVVKSPRRHVAGIGSLEELSIYRIIKSIEVRFFY